MRKVVSLVAVAVLLTAAGCSSKKTPSTSGGGGGGGGKTVTASEKQFSITLDNSSVVAGTVTINAKNVGTIAHELVVFRTSLAEGSLPIKDSAVDESGAGVTKVDEIAEYDPGNTETKAFQLTAGTYVLICNIPTHYQSGMHATLTVT